MEDTSNGNFSSSFASAPPPPPEVKVRTMRTDLEAITKNGGALPRFENVKIPSLSYGRGGSNDPVAVKSKDRAMIVLIVIAIVIAIAFAAYFIYTRVL